MLWRDTILKVKFPEVQETRLDLPPRGRCDLRAWGSKSGMEERLSRLLFNFMFLGDQII